MRAGARGAAGLAGVAVACGLASAASAAGPPPGTPVHTYSGRMIRVIDGSTIAVRIGGHPTTVRLAGVSATGCFAQPSAHGIATMLPARTHVTLAGEGMRPYDARGNLVAYVYRPGRSGASSVNRALLISGQARFGGAAPRTFGAAFIAAARTARTQGRGQWPSCGADPVRPLGGNLTLVQRRLAALGYLPRGYVTHGRLDARTQQALMAFQGWEGITRSGTLDAATRAKLVEPDHLTPADPGPAHLEVSIPKQVLLLVRGDRVLRAIHVSTGAGGRTPTGNFSVYSKQRYSYSRPFQVWLPYASYFYGGYALHEYPDVPGYPASHGCIRMPAGEAPFVYDFVSTGTPVKVLT